MTASTPTRGVTTADIEALIVQAAVDTLAVQTEVIVRRSDFYRHAAEQVSARLRPAWEDMDKTVKLQRAALDVWKKAYPDDSNPGMTATGLRADLAACVTALKRIADTLRPSVAFEELVQLADAALARVEGQGEEA